MKKATGWRRILLAFGNSTRAFVWLSTNEAAFRQELLLAAVLLPIALLADVPLLHKALLIVAILLVLLAEILNTAIEAVVDRIGLERHPLSGLAKDLGSLAVLVAFVMAALIWLTVLWPFLPWT